jgi:DNA polymerase-3 subunit epsilon
MGFINMELERCGKKSLPMDRAVDTVTMARKKFPGAPASLDALCRRFNIDLSKRTKHGALLDAELLAQVYVELTGGRQIGLGLADAAPDTPALTELTPNAPWHRPSADKPRREPRPHVASPEELERHAAFIAEIKGAIWVN